MPASLDHEIRVLKSRGREEYGYGSKAASNFAWAVANKQGKLDNKNKNK